MHLPCSGYHADPCCGESESLSKWAVAGQATFGRCARRPSGSTASRWDSPSPRGRHQGVCLAEASATRDPLGTAHSGGRPRRLPGRQGFLLGRLGATLVSRARGFGGGHPEGQLPTSVAGGRSSVGLWQAPDHRGSHKPAQGPVLPGAPPCQNPRRAASSSAAKIAPTPAGNTSTSTRSSARTGRRSKSSTSS